VTSEEWGSSLLYTIEHFKEIARQNRFAENRSIAHETNRCLICHPELCPTDPFVVYLKVVAESVKVRRPRLDQDLVEELNRDLELAGEPAWISREALMEGNPKAILCWSEWVREALATGLSLLSIHSNTSCEFSLEEAEARGLEAMVETTVKEIMAFQKQHA
jgi:hypothetical protein